MEVIFTASMLQNPMTASRALSPVVLFCS